MNHLAPLTALVRQANDFALPEATALSDVELVEAQRLVGEWRRTADVASARLAAEIARRSGSTFGHGGLAQRLGARTPQELVQRVTGVGRGEAAALMSVGQMLETPAEGAAPWLAAVSSAVEARRVSMDAAALIRLALDGLDLADELLLDAAAELLTAAVTGTDKLAAHARHVRDRLDAAGVAKRESELRDARYICLVPQQNGMTRIHGLLDPETAAEFRAVVDAATSPRRGGPRFIDPADKEREKRLLDDSRSAEQIALDSLLTVMRAGVASGGADVTGALGTNLPAVRIHVSATDLDRGFGAAHLEGQTASVSVHTARRHACTAGAIPIEFDDTGQVLNLGRTQRLFSRQQRIALAARDGGCRFPGCDRPPGWTEAHHINEWDRDHGRTDLADGILLCRHHHMLLHNNGWRVSRTGGDYFVIPPRSIDPEQRPVLAPTKQRASHAA